MYFVCEIISTYCLSAEATRLLIYRYSSLVDRTLNFYGEILTLIENNRFNEFPIFTNMFASCSAVGMNIPSLQKFHTLPT